MNAPVFIAHPPGAIVSENIVELLFQTFVVIPSFILICELACPFTLAPRISNSEELKAIDISDIKDTVGMIKENASLASTVCLSTAIILDDIGATDQKARLVVLL